MVWRWAITTYEHEGKATFLMMREVREQRYM